MTRRFLTRACLLALVFSLQSCGIPQLLGRTAANTLHSLGGLGNIAKAGALAL